MSVTIVTDNPLFGEILQSSCQGRSVKVRRVIENIDAIGHIEPGETLLVHLRNDNRAIPGQIAALQSRFGGFRTLFLVSDRLSAEMLSALRPHGSSIVSERDCVDALMGALTLSELGYHISPLDPAVRSAMLAPLRPEPVPGPAALAPHLSRREATILEHLLEGLSNKCIANRLGITETTVKVHLRSAYRKIGVSNRTQAAMWAAQEFANGLSEASPG